MGFYLNKVLKQLIIMIIIRCIAICLALSYLCHAAPAQKDEKVSALKANKNTALKADGSTALKADSGHSSIAWTKCWHGYRYFVNRNKMNFADAKNTVNQSVEKSHIGK